MIEFSKGHKITKSNATVRNLNTKGIVMSHYGRDKNTEYIDVTGKIEKVFEALCYKPERRGFESQ